MKTDIIMKTDLILQSGSCANTLVGAQDLKWYQYSRFAVYNNFGMRIILMLYRHE
jgi:hypothetical protein